MPEIVLGYESCDVDNILMGCKGVKEFLCIKEKEKMCLAAGEPQLHAGTSKDCTCQGVGGSRTSSVPCQLPVHGTGKRQWQKGLGKVGLPRVAPAAAGGQHSDEAGKDNPAGMEGQASDPWSWWSPKQFSGPTHCGLVASPEVTVSGYSTALYFDPNRPSYLTAGLYDPLKL